VKRIHQIRNAGVMLSGKYNYRPSHGNRMAKIMGLKPYTSTKAGTLFFGCYNTNEYKAIINHKGPRILYWGGSDITYMRKNKFKFPRDVVHVVGCKRNYNELMKCDIEPLIRPVCELDPGLFRIMPLEKNVYVYLPRKRAAFYGLEMVRQVARRLPHTIFLLARYAPKPKPFPNSIVFPLLNLEGLISLYSQCACSIRNTRHDGTSQTNMELMLMGRRTAHPHGSHWGVQCNTVEEYVSFIQREQARTESHTELREKVLREVNNFDFLK